MMINKMLSHWKIARCARASQLYHRGPPLKLRPKTWDSSQDDGRLPARARPIQTVRCNVLAIYIRESNAIDVTFNSLSKSVPQQLGHFSVKFVLKKIV